jgi:hypothetical protein
MAASPLRAGPVSRALRLSWLIAALALYLGLAAWQLGLPGLHYDEAREAGQNAMELLTGAPVTAFRGATVHLFGRDLPLMVQDYIGALKVYLALPILWLTGIGVPNLRALSLLTGLVALLLLERAVSEWLDTTGEKPGLARHAPIHLGALIAVTLAAASPSFVFWSRQGIFVTNLTLPLVLCCLWQGIRWRRLEAEWALITSALMAGLALYAKLLAIWVVAPFALLMAGGWLWARRTGDAPRLRARTLLGAGVAFLIPLIPLILFNVQTGGTLATVAGNLEQSYYGVNNLDLLRNLGVRLPQLREVLEGGQFWYLGGIYRNALAPWLALAVTAAGLMAAWRRVLPPLLLAGLAVGLSVFTVSDLFVTHYALLHPLLVGCLGIAAGALLDRTAGASNERAVQIVLGTAVALWLALDATASIRYHRALARSGGLADHSDASYDFAYALRYTGIGAPLALDWGMDAPIRYLSEGTVTPIELFSYDSLEAPDSGFAERLAPLLANPDVAILLRAPGQEIFRGRRAALEQIVAAHDQRLELEATFAQRDGTPLFELWRVRNAAP